MPDTCRFKNSAALLVDLAKQLTAYDHTRLGVIEVTLHTPTGGCFTFWLPNMLEVIANDLYFDERGDWSDADRISVGTI